MKKCLLIVFLVLLIPVVLLAGPQEVVNYVNNYNGIGDNIRMYLHVASADYEVKGYGYTVVDRGKNCLVKYRFSIGDNEYTAMWVYGKGSGIVDPQNYWARIFMGE